MSIREIEHVTVKVPRFGKYAKWSTQSRFRVGRNWEQPQGVFLKSDLKNTRPVRLFVEEFTAGKKGFWYYKSKFYETDDKNLSEWKFIDLVTALNKRSIS